MKEVIDQPAGLNIISKIIGSIYKRKANYLFILFFISSYFLV